MGRVSVSISRVFNAKNAGQAAEKCAYRIAEEANSEASWQAFLDRYRYNQSFLKEEAEKRLEMVQYQDTIVLGDVAVTPVNLAQDPEGEPNGYAVSVEVKNRTGKTIKYLNMKLDFMSDNDGVIKEDRWPLIAEKNPDKTNRSDEEEPIFAAEGTVFSTTCTNRLVPSTTRERKTPVGIVRLS